MPANDTYWWNQKTLNIVFALSSFVMLLSVILMMQKDHDDEWRPIQRKNLQLEAKIDEVQLTAIEDDTFKAQTGALQQQIGASAAALKKTKAEPGNAELFSTLDAQQRVVDRLEVNLKSKNALRDDLLCLSSCFCQLGLGFFEFTLSLITDLLPRFKKRHALIRRIGWQRITHAQVVN